MNSDRSNSMSLILVMLIPTIVTQVANCTDEHERVLTKYAVTHRSLEERYTGVIPWARGMAPGNGFDSLSLKIKTASNALDFDVGNPDHYWDPVCHYERKLDFKFIETRDELELELGLTAGAKLDLAVATLSGKVTFTNSIRMNNKNIYILIQDYRHNCVHRIKNPVMTNHAEGLFVSNPGRFHNIYGDKFLNSVTTGGAFYGLVEIICESLRHKMEIEAQLKAEVFGFEVAKVSWHRVLRDVLLNKEKDINGQIYVLSNDAPVSIVTTEQFFGTEDEPGAYEKFLKEVSSPACNGQSKLSYRDCPFLVGKFQDYTTLVRKDTESPVELQMLAVERLSKLHRRYNWLRKELAVIEINPENYIFLGSDPPKTRAESVDRINQLIVRTENCMKALDEENESCQKNFMEYATVCQVNPLTICDDSLKNIKADFPARRKRYLSDCKELASYEHCDKDGEYIVYLDGDPDKPFSIFCDFPEKDEPVHDPDEYLTLKRTSPLGERPSYNFSQYRGVPSKENSTENKLTSVYRKIKIAIHQDRVYLDPDQEHYVETLGPSEVLLFDADANFSRRLSRASFSHGYSCRDNLSRVSANIDLTGTPFVVHEETVFEELFAAQTSGQVVRYSGGKSIDLILFSRESCSDVAAVDGLQLVYVRAGD